MSENEDTMLGLPIWFKGAAWSAGFILVSAICWKLLNADLAGGQHWTEISMKMDKLTDKVQELIDIERNKPKTVSY